MPPSLPHPLPSPKHPPGPLVTHPLSARPRPLPQHRRKSGFWDAPAPPLGPPDASEAPRDLKRARADLPAAKARDEFLRLVESHQVVLVSGGTGCGKTTQVRAWTGTVLLAHCSTGVLRAALGVHCAYAGSGSADSPFPSNLFLRPFP